MKNHIFVAVGVMVVSLLTGCTSIHKHAAYRQAGSPVNNKSTLLVGYHLKSVKIDGEPVSILGQGWGVVAWIVEILPGIHEVEGMWDKKKLSGKFEAENGKNYTIQTDTEGFLGVISAYIVELPYSESHNLSSEQRMGFIDTTADKIKKKYKKVADLNLVENAN